jgi:prolipoprotein diacylglyceryltransferase
MLVGGAALVAWWLAVRRGLRHGRPFLYAVAAYSAGRLLVDAFRANSPLTAGGYHLVQIISLATLVVALALIARKASADELPDQVDADSIIAADTSADD